MATKSHHRSAAFLGYKMSVIRLRSAPSDTDTSGPRHLAPKRTRIVPPREDQTLIIMPSVPFISTLRHKFTRRVASAADQLSEANGMDV
jgi:hypothetical protein